MQSSERKIIFEVGPQLEPITSYDEQKDNLGYLFPVLDKDRFLNGSHRNQSGLEIQGELASLPLKSASVDEIWMVNVFGEIYAETIFNNLPRLFYGAEDKIQPAEWDKYLSEVARALKDSGSISLVETYSPPPPKMLASRDLSKFGLKKEVFYGYDIYKYFSEKRMPLAYKRWFECPRINVGEPFVASISKKG